MFERFRPDLVVDNLVQVDPERLRGQGIEGVICDIDNTLLRWDACYPPREAVMWVKAVRESGLKIMLLSNALPRRAQSLSQQLGVPAGAYATKPLRKGFRRALKSMGLTPERVAVIGDQLFTDIWGGNRMGMFTILVQPLGEKELFTTKCLRFIERKVKRRLNLC